MRNLYDPASTVRMRGVCRVSLTFMLSGLDTIKMGVLFIFFLKAQFFPLDPAEPARHQKIHVS